MAIPVHYRVKHHSHETDCEKCGAPIDVGDSAYEYEDNVFCSLGCAGFEVKTVLKPIAGGRWREYTQIVPIAKE
jgi:hypothetical protein